MCLLGRQGLAVRGHDSDDGNFVQFLKLRCEDDDELKAWMQQKQRYMSPDIQNEYLQLLAHDVLRRVTTDIRKARYYSIIADEVTDQSRQHQLGLSVRWVDEPFIVHVDFLELCLLPKGDAETIVKVIQDSLLRFQLPLRDCRGQCYDGASVMAGNTNGVSARMSAVEPRAVFIHCFAHSLNLSLQESSRSLPLYRDMIDYVKDIVNLIRASPKRTGILMAIQQEDEVTSGVMISRKQLRPLCPTRWTTRHESIQSLLDNYACVMETLIEITDIDKSDAGTKAHGFATVMQTFGFYFSLKTASSVFGRAETLSKLLQSKKITVTAALKAMEQVRAFFQKLRGDAEWNTLWKCCIEEAQALHIDEPAVPRLRRPPRRIDSGSDPAAFSPHDYYKAIFFEFLDTIVGTMTERLEQRGLEIYRTIDNTPVEAGNGRMSERQLTESLTTICSHFKDDIDYLKLRRSCEDLPVIMDSKPVTCVEDIINKVVELGPAKRLHSHLVTLLILYRVMPVTSATAERSFSTLRRVKSYLRTTMTQKRLNSVLLLHAHKDYASNIDLCTVANEFVSLNGNRKDVFGTF